MVTTQEAIAELQRRGVAISGPAPQAAPVAPSPGVTIEQALAELQRRGGSVPGRPETLAQRVGVPAGIQEFARGLARGGLETLTGVAQTGTELASRLGIPGAEARRGEVGELVTALQAAPRPTGARAVGRFAGQVAPFIALPGGAATAAGRFGLGALGGGLAAGAQPIAPTEAPGEALLQRAAQAGVGAAVGGPVGAVAAPLAGAVARGVRAVGELTARGVQAVAQRAPEVSPIARQLLGQVREGVSDIPLIGEVQDVLKRQASNLQDQFGTLFTKAQEKGRSAFVKTDDVSGEVLGPLNRILGETIDDDVRALTGNAVNRIQELVDAGPITVNSLQGIRRAATKASVGGGSKGRAAGEIVGVIDDFMDSAFQRNAVTGPKAGIALWKQAISKRREFGSRFEKPALTSKAIGEGETPEGIGSIFLGSGSPGRAKNAAKIFDETVKSAGEEGADVTNLLKQSVVSRMFRVATRSSQEATGGTIDDLIWMRGLANEISSLRRNNKSLFGKFSEDERKALNKLEKDLRKAETGGPINRVGNFVLKILTNNPLLRRQLPTTFAPQQLVTVDDVVRMINLRPDVAAVIPRIPGVVPAAAGVGTVPPIEGAIQ